MKNLSLFEIKETLGSLEKQVLTLITGEVKPRDVLNLINQQSKNYAYTTIMTVMDRLYKKGYLERKKIGKTYFYQSIIPYSQLVNQSLFQLVKNLTNFFSPYKIIVNLTIITILHPVFNFIQLPLVNGLLTGILLIASLFIFLNTIINFYLNGFFEYLLLLFREPSLIINFFSLNLAYLMETFIRPVLILIVFPILLALIIKEKKYYQLNLSN